MCVLNDYAEMAEKIHYKLNIMQSLRRRDEITYHRDDYTYFYNKSDTDFHITSNNKSRPYKKRSKI